MTQRDYNGYTAKKEVVTRNSHNIRLDSKNGLTAMTYATKLSCPIQRTIALIGDKWKILVFCVLRDGTKRFG